MKNRYKQADSKKRRPLSIQMRHRLREGLFLLSLACGLFLLVALATYYPMDPGWSSTGLNNKVLNSGGRVGAFIADVLLSLCGVVAYFFPVLLVLSSWLNLREVDAIPSKRLEKIAKVVGWVLLIGSLSTLINFYFHTTSYLPANTGGILGDLLGKGLRLLFNKTGSTLILITTLLCGITLVTGLSWLAVLDLCGAYVARLYERLKTFLNQQKTTREMLLKVNEDSLEYPKPLIITNETPSIPIIDPVIAKVLPNAAQVLREKKKIELDPNIKLVPGELPPLSLLNPFAVQTEKPFTNISFDALSQLVEQRLADFGVEVKVVAVHPGPVITRFELDLAPGVKVSKINGLAKDIARSLSTISVRIVEVIPGKSVIGLEIPNENREIVTLRDILDSPRYNQSHSPVSLVLGKDISGDPVVVDLSKMPHLLVAGTTGSGKSVSLNAMLLSMLFKAKPTQLRLILIDPKMLELSVYEGIPHLLTPVITDMKDASNALRWCVAEMDRRYRLMSGLGVRNLASYNQKVNDALKQGEGLPLPASLVVDERSAKTLLEPLPMVVVVIDELADMMMVVGKKVEDLIARIAQKARAAGIHLIIATQRPSVDVITGLIKANIPTRIAFQVSSRVDSRTILDQQGAEQLLGHGDMLYLPPGTGVPMRVHGAYVADEEVHRVVAAWRSFGQPEYLYEVTEEALEQAGGGEGSGDESDPLYDEAVRIVTETRRASISLVQRKLRIGYNRAARMMEQMEAAGVVSSMDTSGSREVLAGVPPD